MLLKTEEPVSDLTMHHYTHQLDERPQRRDDIQVEYAIISIRHIVQSELLTEDDLLLVSSLCDHYIKEEQNGQYSHSSSLLSNNVWLFITGIVMVIVAMLPTPSIIYTSIMIVLLLLIITAYKIKCYYRSWLVRKGDAHLRNYLNQFDNLLILFTKCLRLIQETEVISRGYTRLTAWTPASRIEQQGMAGYQCVVLRRCIVKVCKCLLCGLQSASVKLCDNFPLKLELANYQQPPPLEDLSQEEDALSMESLKFLVRLVALHNSGLLRITALCLDGGLQLSDLPFTLPTPIICDAYSSLKQSFEFHRNRVFADKPSSTLHKSSDRKHDNSLVEELTSMDIRTQMILRRLRELIDKFTEATPNVDTIKGVLLELESEYQLIQEQCRSTVKMVSKQDQQCTSSSSVVDNEAVNTSGSESSKSDHCSEEQSSSDSDDEVFEGEASGSENGGDDNQWQEETKEDKETCIAMVKELRNVLTVRTATKTSLKVKRLRKTNTKNMKKGKVPSQNNQTSYQLSNNKPNDVSEEGTVILPSTTTDVQQDPNGGLQCDTKNEILCNINDDAPLTVIPSDTKEEASHDAKDDTLHFNNEEFSQRLLLEDTNPLMMRHIATMAATIALKQSAGSNKQEEVFGNEQ